jgi:post-segregation antitoxin (ccd killing protein)
VILEFLDLFVIVLNCWRRNSIMRGNSHLNSSVFIFCCTVLIFLIAPITGEAAGEKTKVIVEIDSDLLARALQENVDLSALVEKQLKAQLDGDAANAGSMTHMALLTSAFDNFEGMFRAPLKVTKTTPTSDVRAVCKTTNEHLDQLETLADLRAGMPLPKTLVEAKQLDDYLQKRFATFNQQMAQLGPQVQSAMKIMETNCADMNPDEKVAQKAMQTALAPYGPTGWCREMMKTPRGQWSMEDSNNFIKFCRGVKP